MASHASAVKAHRQAEKRRLRNRLHRSRLRTQVKKLRRALDARDADSAKGLLKDTLSILDRSVRAGVIHRNAAARNKSRLTRALSRLGV